MNRNEKLTSFFFDDCAMRLTDLAICLLVLPFVAAVFLVIAIAIKLDDGGPVFFRQIRVGRRRNPFEMLKFRTMKVDPERASGSMENAADLETERAKFQTASTDDPRITKVGRVLRVTHLDELPQVFNVLKGDMSLVGVRPDVPVQEADYTADEWEERHLLRPGITGLAQIDPRANSIPGVRTQKDIEWVRTRRFSVYLRTLVGTVRKIVNRSGV